MSSSPKSPVPPVLVDLAAHRERTRLRGTRRRIDGALRQLRDALTRLHDSQVLFTRHGARVGRDLLDAQLHLLRALALVDRTDQPGAGGPPPAALLETVLTQVDALIERSAVLARRHRAHVESAGEQG